MLPGGGERTLEPLVGVPVGGHARGQLKQLRRGRARASLCGSFGRPFQRRRDRLIWRFRCESQVTRTLFEILTRVRDASMEIALGRASHHRRNSRCEQRVSEPHPLAFKRKDAGRSCRFRSSNNGARIAEDPG
jgi:hypothetical protein